MDAKIPYIVDIITADDKKTFFFFEIQFIWILIVFLLAFGHSFFSFLLRIHQ